MIGGLWNHVDNKEIYLKDTFKRRNVLSPQLLRRKPASSLQCQEVWDPWLSPCFWGTHFWLLRTSHTRSQRRSSIKMDNAAYLFDNRQNYFYFTTKLFISTLYLFFHQWNHHGTNYLHNLLNFLLIDFEF